MTVQLTKDQWYAKIKTFVPSWFWTTELNNKAWASSLAKCAEQLQIALAASVNDTFIMKAAAGVLDTHGAERSIPRVSAELDSPYAVRVQNLFNQSNVVALATLITKVLVSGTARIQEDFASVPFCSRDNYANRAVLFLSTPMVNGFSVVVNKQTHAPFSFCSRDFYESRGEAFCGTDVSLDTVFASIRQIVDDNKAMGTLYRIYELLT